MALTENNNEIKDLIIPGIQKQRFRINGDNDKILELNTSDVNIVTRLNDGYEALNELANEVTKLGDMDEDASNEEQFQTLSERLAEIDTKMREQLDYIFDSNISEVCAANVSMYSPMNGKFMWEHIIDTIGDLYGESFTKEFAQITKNVAKHTEKYVASSKGRRKKA